MTLPTTSFGSATRSTSVLGLGAGGPSRLGTRGQADADSERAVQVVRRAVDLGITFIDTAETYGTEPHIAAAIRDLPPSVSDTLTICTKHAAFSSADAPPRSAAEFTAAIEASIRTLGVDAIDVEQVHGVEPRELDHVREVILPALVAAKDRGLIRLIGLTEMFQRDPEHETLNSVLDDVAEGAPWQSVMVGYNMLNQSASGRVLPSARASKVATIGMFAVRHAMSQPEVLRTIATELATDPRFDADLVQGDDGEPLSWLLDYAESIPEAAYRFCITDPAPDVLLTGTGSIEHLEANVRAVERGPLPAEAVQRLRDALGWVTTETGQRRSR